MKSVWMLGILICVGILTLAQMDQSLLKNGITARFNSSSPSAVTFSVTTLFRSEKFAECYVARAAAFMCNEHGRGARIRWRTKQIGWLTTEINALADCYDRPELAVLGGRHISECLKYENDVLPEWMRSKYAAVYIPKKPDRERLDSVCTYGQSLCLEEIAHRTVQVQASRFDGSGVLGTGFIISSDERMLKVLTAAHVVRTGKAGDRALYPRIGVFDSFSERFASAKYACALRTRKSDAAILLVPNLRAFIYPPVLLDQDSTRGDPAYVVSNRGPEQERWIFKVGGFDNKRREIALAGEANRGDSGAAIISSNGFLLGVLDSTLTLPPFFFNFGSYHDPLYIPVLPAEQQVRGTFDLNEVLTTNFAEHSKNLDCASLE